MARGNLSNAESLEVVNVNASLRSERVAIADSCDWGLGHAIRHRPGSRLKSQRSLPYGYPAKITADLIDEYAMKPSLEFGLFSKAV